MDDINNWIKLTQIRNLTGEQLSCLLQQFNTEDAVVNASQSALKACGLKPAQLEQIKSLDANLETSTRRWLEEPAHHILSYDDENYPEQLKRISDAPAFLHCNGDLDYLYRPQLAMVGSRNPSAAGKHTATDFAKHLSENGLTITSGLARGIDGASHRGALEGIAGTIAVVAHGLDRIYPAEHRELAHQITGNGVIVSEQNLGVQSLPALFPLRNRIISGLSLGVLVVEAAQRSGTLITARHATEQGREVFAIPGSIHNPAAKGCHALIKQGAKLVETAEDILEELQILVKQPASGDTSAKSVVDSPSEPDDDYQALLACLSYEPCSVDQLINCSGLAASVVASMLLILELNGDIVTQNGLYTRVSKRQSI